MTVTIAGTTGITQPTDTCTTSLVLTGSGSGTTTVQAAATASGTITVPAGTGTIAVNGVSSNLVSGSVNAGGTAPFPSSLGPTTVDYTGLPSWIRRITMSFNGVSTSGTANYIIQLGTSGGFVTSGYTGAANVAGGASINYSGFLILNSPAAGNINSGIIIITLLDSSNNIWAESGMLGDAGGAGSSGFNISGWSVPLSGALTQLRLTTVGGANTFDAGRVNILYE